MSSGGDKKNAPEQQQVGSDGDMNTAGDTTTYTTLKMIKLYVREVAVKESVALLSPKPENNSTKKQREAAAE